MKHREIANSFDSDGNGYEITARAGERVRFTVSGTFTGTLLLEQWAHGGPRPLLHLEAPARGAFLVAPMQWASKVTLRYRMTWHRNGVAFATLTVDDGPLGE